MDGRPGLKVCGQVKSYRLGQWNVAHLAALRRRVHLAAGQQFHLPSNVDDTSEEIDVANRQAENLTLT